MTRTRRAVALASLVLLMAVRLELAEATVVTSTTTTTYQHNGDGALTAVTTQVDARPASTTYLTWDNFTPAAAAPSSGTVNAANGNLIGIGASPGTSGLRTALAYDARNRLTDCSPTSGPAASYAYHPASLMASSTLAGGDALQFYYDNAATPRMINTSQPSTGMAASFLGPVRYLSDGSEQVLLSPRKDTAGVYDAAAQSLTPYSYDPYGAPSVSSSMTSDVLDVSTSARPHASTSPPHVSTSAQYDLTQNPFQYAGEYRDPTCNAYYLRARWYLPDHQTFLSRDPADGLHRYSYTAGNPVGRTDPSGFKYTGMEFSRDVDKLVGRLTPGVWAYIAPVLPIWGQALGGIQLAGLLPSFWHHPTTQGYVTFGFLAASMVAEAGSEFRAFDRLLGTSSRAFGSRLGIDVVFGFTQTAAQSYRHGRLDVPSLVQGIEGTAAGIFWDRLVGGVGYRPFNLTADDVDQTVASFHAANPQSTDLLVFRVRENLSPLNSHVGIVGRGLGHFVDGPILDWASVGMYHESLVAIDDTSVLRNEMLGDRTVRDVSAETDYHGFVSTDTPYFGGDAAAVASNPHRSPDFMLVGLLPARQRLLFGTANPFYYPTAEDMDRLPTPPGRRDPSPYGWLTNNTHHHVAEVLRQLNL